MPPPLCPTSPAAFLGGQLLLGLGILVQLNTYSQVLGASSLALVATYPLMKRITGWPQVPGAGGVRGGRSWLAGWLAGVPLRAAGGIEAGSAPACPPATHTCLAPHPQRRLARTSPRHGRYPHCAMLHYAAPHCRPSLGSLSTGGRCWGGRLCGGLVTGALCCPSTWRASAGPWCMTPSMHTWWVVVKVARREGGASAGAGCAGEGGAQHSWGGSCRVQIMGVRQCMCFCMDGWVDGGGGHNNVARCPRAPALSHLLPLLKSKPFFRPTLRPSQLPCEACLSTTLTHPPSCSTQDKADDVKVGIKSTALTFGEHTKAYLTAFSGANLGLLALTGHMAGCGAPYYAGLAAGAAQLAWQVCDCAGEWGRVQGCEAACRVCGCGGASGTCWPPPSGARAAVLTSLAAQRQQRRGCPHPRHRKQQPPVLSPVRLNPCVQVGTVDLDDRDDCMRKFIASSWFGALVFGGIVADRLFA